MYIYEVEVSNVCNLTCHYCPHPTQERRKGFMSLETFAKCVELYHLCENTQPLCLHNFGEVLLHPRLPSLIRHARDRGVRVRFFTNGLDARRRPVTRERWQHLADQGLEEVHFSAHELPLERFREVVHGVIRIDKTFEPSPVRIGTWAGQVGAPDEPSAEPCLFEKQKAFVVLWNGRIAACCIDVEGHGPGLRVDDLLRDPCYEFAPIPLCATCSIMRRPEVM